MNVKLSLVISSNFIYCLEIKRIEAKLNLILAGVFGFMVILWGRTRGGMSVKHGSGKHGRITGCHRVTTVINIYPVFCYLGNKADRMKMYVFL